MKAILPFSANRVTQPIDDEEFSNLVGDIYDAALDQSLWVSVLEKCVGFVGGCGAAPEHHGRRVPPAAGVGRVVRRDQRHLRPARHQPGPPHQHDRPRCAAGLPGPEPGGS